MTQELEPLTYKLQELPKPDTTFVRPLGIQETLPFKVNRTFRGNLPVYTDYRNGGMRKLTVLRQVEGDIDVRKSVTL